MGANLLRRLFYTGSCLFEIARGIILVAVLVTLIHLFIATVFIVEGVSMEPNLHTSELVLVDRASYLFGEPARGDIVVLRFPGDPENRKYIKRLIGLPGETVDIQSGRVLINNQPLAEAYLPLERLTGEAIPGKTHWVLGDDEFFLIGDNRNNSNDSRTWDAANRRFLIGKAVFILLPFADAGLIPKETYGL